MPAEDLAWLRVCMQSLAAWLLLAGDVVVRELITMRPDGTRAPAVRVLTIGAEHSETITCRADGTKRHGLAYLRSDGSVMAAESVESAANEVRGLLGLAPYIQGNGGTTR